MFVVEILESVPTVSYVVDGKWCGIWPLGSRDSLHGARCRLFLFG